MNQLAQRLRSAYPLSIAVHEVLPRAIGIGLFVWLFLWVFAPFGLDGLARWPRLWVTAGYGIITCATTLLCMSGAPRLLPRLFAERQWTVAHHSAFTLANLLLIAAGNWAYTRALGYSEASVPGMLQMLGFTLLVASFPVTAVIYLQQARLERHYHTTAMSMGAPIASPPAAHVSAAPLQPGQQLAPPPDTIPLTGTLATEQLHVAPSDLLLLTAADNYVQVHLLRGGVPARVLLRQSLANLEQQLAPWPQFMRVHRSHVVNLSLVQGVSGNAQGYRLQLAHLPEVVPVSRAYSAAVRARLHSPGAH